MILSDFLIKINEASHTGEQLNPEPLEISVVNSEGDLLNILDVKYNVFSRQVVVITAEEED
jgi:hypothetical protein